MISLNRTENFVKQFLLALSIAHPDELSVESISNTINLSVNKWEYPSEAVCFKGKFKIFINENESSQKQWQNFGHELGHVLWHVGRQEKLPIDFMQLQEKQANLFAYHLCVPTFMLNNLYNFTVYDVMTLFNVEYEFASKRLEMYKNKVLTRGVV